jgi:ribosomal protein L11 methyltransferase
MRWTELSIQVPGEFAEPVTHLFSKHGEGAAVVEMPADYNPDEGESPAIDGPVTLKTYIPAGPTARSRREMIDVGLRLIAYLCPLPPLNVREIDDSEWRNQTFDPIRVGRRLVIAPPGSEGKLRSGDITIPLEPGLAFGTGHHPTTAMVLAAMEDAALEGAEVLDAGCGSGILSIAAIMLGAEHVYAFDIEDDAVGSTMLNTQRAGVAGKVTLIHTSIPDERIPEGAFDFVLANISANVLIKLSDHIVATLKPAGTVIASGVLEERYADAVAAFKAAGGRVFDKRVTGDWTCFKVSRA